MNVVCLSLKINNIFKYIQNNRPRSIGCNTSVISEFFLHGGEKKKKKKGSLLSVKVGNHSSIVPLIWSQQMESFIRQFELLLLSFNDDE